MKYVIPSVLVCVLLTAPQVALAQVPAGPAMCACPGKHKPLGNNGTCEDACYGTRSSPGGGQGIDYGAIDAQRRAQEAAAAAAAAAERQRQADADRIERERVAEQKRQKDAKFIRDRDATASTLKGSSGDAMSQLKGLSGTDSFGLKGGAFDTGNTGSKELRGSDQKKASKTVPHTDTSVVDARMPLDGTYLTNQVAELKNSLAADRITKGFQAVIKHDWPVALAWWRDALNRDSNNVALKRSVDLAQWMVDQRKAKAAGPATPLGAAIHSASRGDNVKAIRQFELAKTENPAIAPQAEDMITALRKRQAKDAKGAAYWTREIERGQRQMVDEMFETGMNSLSIGDEKGAQAAFRDADFFSMSLPAGGQRPSQSPASKSKSGNTK